MNPILRTTILCAAAAAVAIAATSKTPKRLTPQRLFELTAPGEASLAQSYRVEISSLGVAVLPAGEPKGQIESGRDLIFPTAFDPPQAAANGAPVLTPTTPTEFETLTTGWTIRLSAKPQGKLITVYGVADYVQAELVPGGYGAIAGPIYDEQGGVITPNKLDQPRLQTTTTRFNVFAVPGESYEVLLYRGNKAEKHLLKVTAE